MAAIGAENSGWKSGYWFLWVHPWENGQVGNHGHIRCRSEFDGPLEHDPHHRAKQRLLRGFQFQKGPFDRKGHRGAVSQGRRNQSILAFSSTITHFRSRTFRSVRLWQLGSFSATGCGNRKGLPYAMMNRDLSILFTRVRQLLKVLLCSDVRVGGG